MNEASMIHSADIEVDLEEPVIQRIGSRSHPKTKTLDIHDGSSDSPFNSTVKQEDVCPPPLEDHLMASHEQFTRDNPPHKTKLTRLLIQPNNHVSPAFMNDTTFNDESFSLVNRTPTAEVQVSESIPQIKRNRSESKDRIEEAESHMEISAAGYPSQSQVSSPYKRRIDIRLASGVGSQWNSAGAGGEDRPIESSGTLDRLSKRQQVHHRPSSFNLLAQSHDGEQRSPDTHRGDDSAIMCKLPQLQQMPQYLVHQETPEAGTGMTSRKNHTAEKSNSKQQQHLELPHLEVSSGDVSSPAVKAESEFLEEVEEAEEDKEVSRFRKGLNLFLYNSEVKPESSDNLMREDGALISDEQKSKMEDHRYIIIRQFLSFELVIKGILLLAQSYTHYFQEYEELDGSYKILLFVEISSFVTGILIIVQSVRSRDTKLVLWLAGMLIANDYITQLIIFYTQSEDSAPELIVQLLMTLIRMTFTMASTQFILDLRIKLGLTCLHAGFSFMTLLMITDKLGFTISDFRKHRADVFMVFFMIAIIYLQSVSIFYLEKAHAIQNVIQVQRMVDHFSTILKNLKVGLISVQGNGRRRKESDLLFLNQTAMEVMGKGDCQWEEFKTMDGLAYSQKKGVSKDEMDSLFSKKLFHLTVDRRPASSKNDRLSEGSSPQNGLRPRFKHSSGLDSFKKGSSVQIQDFSINDMLRFRPEKLETCIFQMMESSISDEEKITKYFKIQRHTFFIHSKQFELLHVVDITKEYNLNQGEKKLLSLINATVSHEMRTPINSIQSQNVQIRHLIDKMSDLLNDESIDNVGVLRLRMNKLHMQLRKSNMIHSCSTKFLTFEINDMLDYSQLKQGKFRKVISRFNVKKALHDIMMVQEYKAEQMGVRVNLNFLGFPSTGDNSDYQICTDEQRLQQVLMNLISNALKFTPSGGRIEVLCEFIPPMMIKKSKTSRVRFSVKDSGIGIKKADQKKLFKLFGFLDATKELNTKGIGLGLHICQLIVNFFGGTIQVQSEFRRGATFTFDFALENATDAMMSTKIPRNKNPQQKLYPKIRFSIPAKTNRSHSVHQTTMTEGEVEQLRQKLSQIEKEQEGRESKDPSASMAVIQSVRSIVGGSGFHSTRDIRRRSVYVHSSIDNQGRRQTDVSVMKQRILVVDDDPFNIEAIRVLLDKVSIRNILSIVDFAKNGQEALKLATRGLEKGMKKSSPASSIDQIKLNALRRDSIKEGRLYSLIFMDCSMPIMDGFEATEEIRDLYQKHQVQQPIIVACTGHCEPEYIQKAWRNDMDEVVSKPLKLEVLNEILEEHIEILE